MAVDTIATTDEQALALQLAREYLAANKKWSEGDFRLVALRQIADVATHTIVMEVVHEADRSNVHRGGGQSLQLHIDLRSRKIVKELAYQ